MLYCVKIVIREKLIDMKSQNNRISSKNKDFKQKLSFTMQAKRIKEGLLITLLVWDMRKIKEDSNYKNLMRMQMFEPYIEHKIYRLEEMDLSTF